MHCAVGKSINSHATYQRLLTRRVLASRPWVAPHGDCVAATALHRRVPDISTRSTKADPCGRGARDTDRNLIGADGARSSVQAAPAGKYVDSRHSCTRSGIFTSVMPSHNPAARFRITALTCDAFGCVVDGTLYKQ